jgi:hypothetical protein
MKKITAILSTTILCTTATIATAAERPDVYVVKFRADNCATCAGMEYQLDNAMNMVRSSKVELVTIDSTNGLKWEVSAHKAFDRDFVPQFNNWVGLTGFVAVIDRQSRRTIGCINDKQDMYKMANFIKVTAGLPHDQTVSNRSGQFQCPEVFNVDPGM